MRRVVFQIPFQADPAQIGRFVEIVSLEPARTDDWDSQLGFRLFGTDGAVRLFRTSGDPSNGKAIGFEVHGTAVRRAAVEVVAAEYEKCRMAIERIDGTVMKSGVVPPPGVELGDGRDDFSPQATT
jgi:hypothetical protein